MLTMTIHLSLYEFYTDHKIYKNYKWKFLKEHIYFSLKYI